MNYKKYSSNSSSSCGFISKLFVVLTLAFFTFLPVPSFAFDSDRYFFVKDFKTSKKRC